MRTLLLSLGVLQVMLLLAGCSSSSNWNFAPVEQYIDVSGRYLSDDIASFGEVELILRKDEDGGFFRAEMSQRINGGAGESIGVGTIGDTHLILNFDRRLPTDYYFEGEVAVSGETIESITGAFVFTGALGNLPASFEYMGEAPPVEEPEE